MKIRTKFKIIIMASLIFTIFSGLINFWLIKLEDKALEMDKVASELTLYIFERTSLRSQYFMFHEERAKVQWFIAHELVEKFLSIASDKFKGPEEKTLLKRMRDNHAKIGEAFRKMVLAYEKRKGKDFSNRYYSELEDRVMGNLLINAGIIFSDALHLRRITSEKLANIRAIAYRTILWSTGIFLGLVLLVSYLLIKAITSPLSKLHKGMEIIAEGDLDYKTNIRTPDEIGQLSDALDTMVAKLKAITVSRDELSEEIENRKRTEESLRTLSSRQEAILSAVPDIIMEVDNNKVYTWANPAGFEFFGEDVLGKEAAFYFAGEQATYNVVQPLFDGEENVIYVESWQRRKDGERRLLAWWCRVLKDESGNLTGALSSAHDVTGRKRAEEERERLLAEIAAKNQELESFAYTVSHDLRAPLVSLEGFSSLLKRESQNQLGKQGQHYLERIRANVAHMNTLTTELLELSRIGRVVGPEAEIDVGALVRQIQEGLALKLEQEGVEFIVQEPLPAVRGDRGRIRQVFANLIENAVKFRSLERGLRIEVGCEEEGGFYRFHVGDNGIGILPQYQEQIFEPFRQLDRGLEGVGMGLTLVKRIVEHHGGRVWVESEAGKGATFFFTLPMKGESK